MQNEERIATLTDEVAALELQIRSKNLQRGETKEQQAAAKLAGGGGGSDSDDGNQTLNSPLGGAKNAFFFLGSIF